MRGRSNRKLDEETQYWLSYSDMMAGLLLTFVLIITLTTLHSRIQYDQKENELLGKQQELVIQSEQLENERLTVDEQAAVLNAQEAKLTEQAEKMALQRAQLEEQESTLKTQADILRQQSVLLQELEKLMGEQQEKLDRIIGVRSELIEALKEEFEGSSLNISVDQSTGSITMASSILFDHNESVLKDSGKQFLNEFFPRYASILLSPDYRDYVSEIIVEGHTDTEGTYLFNLDLSQKRAYSVAEYCMADETSTLSEEQKTAIQEVLATTGKTMSNPILNEDGTVDMESSRRVEILFRLKDEEMIREMIDILNAEETNSERMSAEYTDPGRITVVGPDTANSGPGVEGSASGGRETPNVGDGGYDFGRDPEIIGWGYQGPNRLEQPGQTKASQ